MSSKYLEWKYRDVRPEEKKPLTAAEKRKNWWHYHKWHVAAGAVLLWAALDIGFHALGIGEVRPDYQLAYIGAAPLPAETAAALETALAALGEDANGDGTVVVRVNQYAGSASAEDIAATHAAARNVQIIADLESCESYFFLLDDPETFQANYGILARPDGSLPPEDEADGSGCFLRWSDCPVLAALELGDYTETALGREVTGSSQELLSGLYLARRGFGTGKTVRNEASCERLWETLLGGTSR